ncbi:MAG: putative DNA-directed RNA polymerase subunit Rpb10 [Faunusvirus sp.]|jgi:DNA-directed RNA polymerase subunit N (RpoN/RPB10)|uniref:Putative DNA-directed RNA polymerase subunit Rpb10 n=1 Tax=Faunusvirus sp. TaxID=2487766 RepID=A0A3G4ZXV8_9VIRU|nr:MAG: putative DNA-directed RNA polymerase subunit Rpb10 [Faunusvirus sp.]
MLYVRCPTCAKLLGDKQIPLEQGKAKICGNPKYSQEEIEKKLQDLVNSFGLTRYCCKARLDRYIRKVDIIV